MYLTVRHKQAFNAHAGLCWKSQRCMPCSSCCTSPSWPRAQVQAKQLGAGKKPVLLGACPFWKPCPVAKVLGVMNIITGIFVESLAPSQVSAAFLMGFWHQDLVVCQRCALERLMASLGCEWLLRENRLQYNRSSASLRRHFSESAILGIG